jgi:hypothetical protein
MKKFSLVLAGLGIAAASVPAAAVAAPAPHFASYQGGWQNINARQAKLEARINQGVRSGSLTRAEAARLRAQFRDLNRLEARYRATRPGLTLAERRDLDRRFDALASRIRFEKHDRQGYRGR